MRALQALFHGLFVSLALATGPVTLAAADEFGSFLPKIAGSFYGEVHGIWQAWWSASAYDLRKPWEILHIDIKIVEGEEERFSAQISRNATDFNAPAYFLSLTNKGTGTKLVFVLGPQTGERKFPFWRHEVWQRSDEVTVTSMRGIELSFNDRNELVFAFIHGQEYCTTGNSTYRCATDSYRPFQLKKVDD